ncbi:serine/threonine protein kinase prp4, putative [Entamoeba invadens IP1]|uniref:Serine/threonine protein kinase prp4, putative n=1 Tax=Entamoeba invadens IP1 TaxID=370355 RepID=A0A0A1U9K8_ENTIV|nr:serine/threonine protein kinase prp4, putative [Entamoeba invadens IP1]ELP91671.1 serine/threonine protein kinase prp4, putative [Entamoeba invadens IP1]|eukprot:XP_004258442.1 serine/threonine protein kinase prp4, putative [Entamoeba invadens IP1]
MSGIDIFGDDSSVECNGTELQVTQSEAIESTTDADGYFVGRSGEAVGGYTIVCRIGQGTFGSVYEVDKKGERYAMKIVRNNESMVKACQREAEVVKEVEKEGREYVVMLLSEFKYKEHYCLVTELMEKSLRVLMNTRHCDYTVCELQKLTTDVLKALDMLHRVCSVVHCDIKPDNILIVNNTAKLGDFGSAVRLHEREQSDEIGSRFYRAPEVMVGNKFDTKYDMWSVGVMLYEVVIGCVPFSGDSNNDMLYHIITIRGRIPQKMVRDGVYANIHFVDENTFLHNEIDPFGKCVNRRVKNGCDGKKLFPTLTLRDFTQLIDKLLIVDPLKRASAQTALGFDFCTKTYEPTLALSQFKK